MCGQHINMLPLNKNMLKKDNGVIFKKDNKPAAHPPPAAHPAPVGPWHAPVRTVMPSQFKDAVGNLKIVFNKR